MAPNTSGSRSGPSELKRLVLVAATRFSRSRHDNADLTTTSGVHAAAVRLNHPPYQPANWVIWMTLPQVSLSLAIVAYFTSVGARVKVTPNALMRS